MFSSNLIPLVKYIFDDKYDNIMTEEYYVGTEPGDIILFDARIKHMGGRYNGERPTVYAAIGKDNEQSKLHAEGAIDRQSKQNQQEYSLQNYVKEKLDSLGIVY